MNIRKAEPDDQEAIWRILKPAIRAGETYALPRDMSRAGALAYWLADEKHSFVAEKDDRVVATYYLRANQADGGHVCNCGYVTDEAARGQGIARPLCEHSLKVARDLGFRAMPFNCVVSTNEGSVALWQKLGFDIVGTLPGAFHHPVEGDVDAFVM